MPGFTRLMTVFSHFQVDKDKVWTQFEEDRFNEP